MSVTSDMLNVDEAQRTTHRTKKEEYFVKTKSKYNQTSSAKAYEIQKQVK